MNEEQAYELERWARWLVFDRVPEIPLPDIPRCVYALRPQEWDVYQVTKEQLLESALHDQFGEPHRVE